MKAKPNHLWNLLRSTGLLLLLGSLLLAGMGGSGVSVLGSVLARVTSPLLPGNASEEEEERQEKEESVETTLSVCNRARSGLSHVEGRTSHRVHLSLIVICRAALLNRLLSPAETVPQGSGAFLRC